MDNPKLKILEDLLEEISGEWNGDLPGLQEDMAHAANEALEKIKELKVLLEELELSY